MEKRGLGKKVPLICMSTFLTEHTILYLVVYKQISAVFFFLMNKSWRQGSQFVQCGVKVFAVIVKDSLTLFHYTHSVLQLYLLKNI